MVQVFTSPIGLCTGSEQYPRKLHEIFENLNGIIIIANDILILGYGVDSEEIEKVLIDRVNCCVQTITANRDKSFERLQIMLVARKNY